MRQAVLALAACLALAGCGGGDERAARDDDGGFLGGMRGALTEAVARRVPGRGICGDPRLAGEPVGLVTGKLPGCGIEEAVRISRVDGIALSQGAVIDCPTARRFADWVENGARPAIGQRGGGIAEFRVAAHYACRTRNHRAGAPISEHGRGKAIDISAITLADGETITLIDDWGRGRNGRALRRMQDAACGPFGTVLGPDSDRWHKDHFHFDTADHRGGPYCP